jgi:serine/threonine protein kinase
MALLSGARLGSYEVIAPLGQGGMGEVYRARDTKLNRDVAIKVLPASFAADADRLKRFEQEARTAGALNHPNLVTIFELGVAEGSPYIVMELVEGETLRQRLAGALPVRKAIDYAMQIAQGLAAAHDRGIVHRDLKPENVIVTPDGRLKTLDFGLAKAFARAIKNDGGSLETGLFDGTSPGTVLGTVGYMAPEQVRGESTIDSRADIFALGAILYEMLSGRRAFQADSAVETMNAILREEPPDPTRGVVEAPPGLSRLVQRCLEKSPAERFQSARDLAFHLGALSGDSGGHAGATVAASVSGPSRISRPLLVGGGIIVGALGGLALGWLLLRQPLVEPPRFETFTYSGSDSTPAVSPDGKTIAFSSARNGKRQIWFKQFDGSGEIARTPGPDDRSPRFSPDGTSMLFLREDNGHLDLFRTAVLGGEEHRVLSDVVAADWSPDGVSIAFAGFSAQNSAIVGIVQANGSNRREVLGLPDWSPTSVAWSPDGTWLLGTFAANAGSLSTRAMLIPAAGGAPRELPAASGIASVAAWTASGHEVVYAASASKLSARLRQTESGSTRIVAHDLDTDRVRTLFWTLKAPSVVDIVSPGTLVFDGIAVVQNLRAVSLARPGQNARVPAWLTRGSSVDRQPAFSPDGNTVIFASNRSRNLDLWTLSRRDGSIRRMTDDAAADWDPAFTPDGASIIWSSNRGGNFEIWMAAADGSGARQVTRDGVDAENPTMTHDGRWIVYYSADPAKAGIWKVHPDGTGAEVLARGPYGVAEVSPDGRYAVFAGVRQARGRQLLVRRIEDNADVGFSIYVERNGSIDENYGRLRWLPGGKAIVFTAVGADHVMGVFAQDFVPGQDTSATRRKLAGFFTDARTESFGMSPDGSVIVISGVETSSDVLLAHGIPNLLPPGRGRR